MFSRSCLQRWDGDSEHSGFKRFIQFFIIASGLGKAGLLSPKQKWKKKKALNCRWKETISLCLFHMVLLVGMS